MLSRVLRRPLFGAWIVWYAVLLHVVWGTVMLVGGDVSQNVTAIAELSIAVPDGAVALGLVLISVGVLSALALFERTASTRSLVMLLPQQATLTISAFGAIHAMSVGHFADGVVRPRAFLVADQLPAVLTVALHTVAILYLHLGARDPR